MNPKIIIGEIIFNPNIHLFLYLNLTTQKILNFKLILDNDDDDDDDIISDNDRLPGPQKRTLQSILKTFQKLLILELLKGDTRPLRRWRETLPQKFKVKGISKEKRSQNSEFQKLLYESTYFREKIKSIIPKVISTYATSQIPNILEEDLLMQVDTPVDQNIHNISSMEKVQQIIYSILTSNLEGEQKVAQIFSLVLQQQNGSTQLMKQGFIHLAIQNKQLQEKIETLQKQLEIVTKQLSEKKQQEQLILEKRERRKNRKRQSKREPITPEIYQFLIDEANALNYSNSFRGARLRLALALLLLTGVRIGELLPLKIGQVKTLFQESWIAIDRTKGGPPNHKAFLTKEGKKILKDRLSDLEILSYFKKDDSYIFTADNSEKPLQHEAWNRIVNGFIKQSSEKLDGKPKLRSHSFRIGYITQLWKHTSDLELVRQTIGHLTINTTSQYVTELSDEERKQRISEIDETNYNKRI